LERGREGEREGGREGGREAGRERETNTRLPPCLWHPGPAARTKPDGFTDSDWAADLDNNKSTGACLFMLDGRGRLLQLDSHQVKLSPTGCLSTQKAEYYALSEGTSGELRRLSTCASSFATSVLDNRFRNRSSATTIAPSPWRSTLPTSLLHAILTCAFSSVANMSNWAMSPQPSTPHPTWLADFLTKTNKTPDSRTSLKQTKRLTHERHCRRVFGNQLAPIPLEPTVRVLV